MHLVKGTCHSSGVAASHTYNNRELFSSQQLWALTWLTFTPVLNEMVMQGLDWARS